MKEVIDDKVIDTYSNKNVGTQTGAVGKIPKAMKIFIYGIVAICTSMFLVGFVFAIIALVWERKAMKILESNYSLYKYEKWKLLVGKGLAWGSIGLALFYWGYVALIIAINT